MTIISTILWHIHYHCTTNRCNYKCKHMRFNNWRCTMYYLMMVRKAETCCNVVGNILLCFDRFKKINWINTTGCILLRKYTNLTHLSLFSFSLMGKYKWASGYKHSIISYDIMLDSLDTGSVVKYLFPHKPTHPKWIMHCAKTSCDYKRDELVTIL
jgi:hypothetical protein